MHCYAVETSFSTFLKQLLCFTVKYNFFTSVVPLKKVIISFPHAFKVYSMGVYSNMFFLRKLLKYV
jgi:hypothetical protein